MKKSLLTAAVCAMVLSSGFMLAEVVNAAPGDNGGKSGFTQQKNGERPMRRPRPTKEQIIEMTSQRTGVPKAELEALVASGTQPMDLGMICGYAKANNKPLAEIAEMRKTMTVGRIDYALGITPGIKAQRSLDNQAKELVNDNVVNQATAVKLLQKGYTAGDIKIAQALAVRSNKKLEAVLKLKVAATKWKDVAQKLGVNEADYKELSSKMRIRPARKPGPGFSNIHFKKIDKELISNVLSDNYNFSKEEIGKYCDAGLSFGEIDLMCLYAYLADKPLATVISMRNKYTEKQIEQKLGLTPKLIHEKVIAYQARRLEDRLGLPAKVTNEYMLKGYAMHHMAVAHLVAPLCGKDFDTVLAAKVPSKRWTVVAKELGLTQEQYKTVTDKISYEFRTKYE